jgi:hypothetical protein
MLRLSGSINNNYSLPIRMAASELGPKFKITTLVGSRITLDTTLIESWIILDATLVVNIC